MTTITLQHIKASDLTVVPEIQRIPTDARVRDLRENWQDPLCGILSVAYLTDGRHQGQKHVYDGGSRWAAMMRILTGCATPPNPDYVFACVVTEMTEMEAAAAFLAHNGLAKHPGEWQRFTVGLQAEWQPYMAMQDAFEEVGVVAGTHATRSDGADPTLAAIAAARRIVELGRKRFLQLPGVDKTDPTVQRLAWVAGTDALVQALTLSREIYDDEGAFDADYIQGLARLQMCNPWIGREIDTADRNANVRLKEKLIELPLQQLRTMATSATQVTVGGGGSTSRSTMFAKVIANQHNQRLRRNSPYRLKATLGRVLDEEEE